MDRRWPVTGVQITVEMIRNARGGEFQRAMDLWFAEFARDIHRHWERDEYLVTCYDPDLWIDMGL